MAKRFPEYKSLDLSKINKDILEIWDKEGTFEESLKERNGKGEFVFYEGPPSANGIPGIHHVMARTIKDVICRYKTQQGYLVRRKAGWDTHGLPVELGVEKSLGITKEDIGKKITVAEYNAACRTDVMKYTDLWEDLTRKMGYWVNMDDPYITYDNRYIETLWHLLKNLFDKGFIYRGYTIQPFSPGAGTGLSSHELNLPGCYRDVKDTTAVALFSVIKNGKSDFLFEGIDTESVQIMAWTTTPWTLPSNTALAVGKDIKYSRIKTFNPYTGDAITVILATDLAVNFFRLEDKVESGDRRQATGDRDNWPEYSAGSKSLPWSFIDEIKGKKLEGIEFEQLIDWVNPGEGAFRIVTGDFVTTEEGTGIVHIAPTFGADDMKVARENNIPPLIVDMADGSKGPLVDRRGYMVPVADLDKEYVRKMVNTSSYAPFQGRPVKNEYDAKLTEADTTLDIDIAVMLKQAGKAFRIEKHVHSYPHCWRTDKPVLYYPLDSWFIKTTAVRDRMIELNNTINWKPASTGTGRFGKWLENLVDWNLSRSRYWGTPLPIWYSEDRKEHKCIGSVEELRKEIDSSVRAGFMSVNPLGKFVNGDNSSENYSTFDLHRPFVDDIVLVSPTGQSMKREEDLIDVWFDSGAMPYAQAHWPFENKDNFNTMFPADYIAEGVDQTRGWFFTLHAIAVMTSDSVAFKNIISNGLVLDKSGNKMSKRLGNAVDPFVSIEEHGSDPLRWYMMTNAQPWDNLKFDMSGVEEVKRKFFGTLYNTYSFFSLYANVDSYRTSDKIVPVSERPEIDRWIISLLNTLIKKVGAYYEDYDITPAGREISAFVTENLSNWYVRLNRKRYWGGEMNDDKLAAYQTLHECLEKVALLAAPIAPFYMERLYRDLNDSAGTTNHTSVHLVHFPAFDESLIDRALEERMEMAQQISSMILALRRKVSIKVRQPLAKIMIPATGDMMVKQIEAIKDLILTETNIKEIEYIDDTTGILVKKIKPNFRALGPKMGKMMKEAGVVISAMTQPEISAFEKSGNHLITVGGEAITITHDDVEIISEDIPGWLVTNEGRLTVALDVTVTDELRQEGIAREFVNRIQNIRKDSGFEVTDKISVVIEEHPMVADAVRRYADYISSQTLAVSVVLAKSVNEDDSNEVEIEEVVIKVLVSRV